MWYISGLVEDCGMFSVLALEIAQFCTVIDIHVCKKNIGEQFST